jgi:putative ABC transport system substrate-binding protein
MRARQPGSSWTARILLVLIGAVLMAGTTGAGAQQQSKVVRIGYLQADAPDELVDAFRQGLQALGYIDGQNVVIEARFGYGHFDRLPKLADELVRLDVSIIVTASTPATLAAQRATSTIPIVAASAGDPVATGIARSLARPGGNVTGLSLMLQDVAIKRLEVLKEAVPRIASVAVLWSGTNPVYARIVEQLKQVAPRMKMRANIFRIDSPEQLERGLTDVERSHSAALYVFEDPVFRSNAAHIVSFAERAHLPAIYGGVEEVRVGGMLSYGPSHADMFRRAAGFVDKILKGAKPGDLPIEQPTKFDLAVNLKSAQALGIVIPESILLRADEVIR